ETSRRNRRKADEPAKPADIPSASRLPALAGTASGQRRCIWRVLRQRSPPGFAAKLRRANPIERRRRYTRALFLADPPRGPAPPWRPVRGRIPANIPRSVCPGATPAAGAPIRRAAPLRDVRLGRPKSPSYQHAPLPDNTAGTVFTRIFTSTKKFWLSI